MARDPKRIDYMLRELGCVWKKCPDMRLAQLISCCMPHNRDIFYVEDNQLMEGLAKMDGLMPEDGKGKL